MKKIFQTLILILFAQVALGQQQCQALFTTYFDATTDSLYVYNNSYNIDSTPIVVTSYEYTIQYNGGTLLTSTVNPTQVLLSNFMGEVLVCLTITTSTGCSSTYCDSVFISNGNNNCIADFNYQSTTAPTVNFADMSIPEYPAGTFNYSWTFENGTPATSNLANPVVVFPGNGMYNVCLTVASDSGCTATYCQDIYVMDSIPNNCTLQITPYISHVTTIGGSDGFIDLSVSGGIPPYVFYWNTGVFAEDIYGLTAGVYTVNIYQADSLCPATYATFQIMEPYDSIPNDTLIIAPIDTCFSFLPDSFYVVIVQVDSMNATVTWTFTGQGQMITLTVTYPFPDYGPYVIALSLNCDSAKNLTTYMTYVNFAEVLGVPENASIDFTAYPNPFSDRIEMDVPQGIQDAAIYNVMGQLMWTASAIGTGKLSIDAATWPAGFYTIRLQGAESNASKLMIKQ